MLTAQHLRRFLTYDPATGAFRWRVRLGRGAPGCIAGAQHHSGYVQIGIHGRLYFAHQLAWLYVKGAWPSRELDHRNRVRHDNRWENLRPATRKQNGENTTLRRDNSSGIKGVYWVQRVGLWTASITHHGTPIYLGHFRSKAAAGEARRAAEKRYFTHA